MQRISATAFMFLCVAMAAPAAMADTNLNMVNRIRAEGFERSRVMETMEYLTDEIGPRLTGSPQMLRANRWTKSQLSRWGLKGARLEGFEFGRGWSFERTSVHMLEPHKLPLTALPRAWTPGTNGPVRGDAMLVDIENEADLARFRGKVRGKILFVSEPEVQDPPGETFKRFSDTELRELRSFPVPIHHPPAWRKAARRRWSLREKLRAFVTREKPAALVSISSRDAGLVRLGGANHRVGKSATAPELVMASEHYNQIVRLLRKGKRVQLEIDVVARFHDDTTKAYNTIAEIPGRNRNEVVMVGAHLDSWHPGTGAVDNAAGCAIVMEAVRILSVLRVKPRRTIRIALWAGEEQGLLGSRAYVEKHFATRPKPKDAVEAEMPRWLRDDKEWPIRLKPAHKGLSAYFNIDNGSGRIRGVWAEGNAAVKPIFSSWLAPLSDLGATTVTLRRTGGTDHQSFDGVGLPGFQFIQDGLDYRARLHHTNVDVLDHVQEKDLMQASVVLATFLYNAATRAERIPRKPMPRKDPPWLDKRKRQQKKHMEDAAKRKHRRNAP